MLDYECKSSPLNKLQSIELILFKKLIKYLKTNNQSSQDYDRFFLHFYFHNNFNIKKVT